MKGPIGRFVTGVAALAALNLAIAASRAAEPSLAASAVAPRIVSARGTLTPLEIAKYQVKSARARTAAHDKSAGASDKKTTWIVVGVLVAVGAIALAAGGGGGGGGGY